jgi:hypothetical protein
MTPRTGLIAALLGGVALLVAVAGWWFIAAGHSNDGASWSSSDRAGFIRSCIEECRKSPGVTEDKYPLCDRACTCGADEGEKIMTAGELAAVAQALASGKATAEQSAKMDRIKAAGMSCVTTPPPAQK